MSRFLFFLQKLALSFWIGEMLFFIIIFAPRVFKVLEKPQAADLQANIFPAYYLAGCICGVVFVIASLMRGFQNSAALPGRRTSSWIYGLAFFAIAVFTYSLLCITPEISALQPELFSTTPTPETRAQFDHLHSLSVKLNGAALLSLLALLFLI
jgi:hypothetical protein